MTETVVTCTGCGDHVTTIIDDAPGDLAGILTTHDTTCPHHSLTRCDHRGPCYEQHPQETT